MNSTPKSERIIAGKAYDFALGIIKLYKSLIERREFVLSKQILRSGTSIGANVNEAISAQSKRDFVHKLSISLKEARETIYWLRLLKDSDYMNEAEFDKMFTACDELIKILTKIILTTKEKYLTKNNTNS